VAPSLITSYYVQISPQGTSALVTPSFTPSNGEVLVIKLVTWDSAAAMGAPTGGSQTYTSGSSTPRAASTNGVASTPPSSPARPGSMTVSSTPSTSLRGSMVVERWSGAQLAATPVTASSASLGAPGQRHDHPVVRDEHHLLVRRGRRVGRPGDEGVPELGHQRGRPRRSRRQQRRRLPRLGCVDRIEQPELRPVRADRHDVRDRRHRGPGLRPARRQRIRRTSSSAAGCSSPPQVRGVARIATPVRDQVNPPFPFTGHQAAPAAARSAGPPWRDVHPGAVSGGCRGSVFPPRPVRARLKGLRLYRGRCSPRRPSS
jgi:hypothetical protein